MPSGTRRTKADMADIRAAIVAFATAEAPVTVRQVFYNLTTRNLVEKSEKDYGSTVSRLMVEMRESGELDWDLVSDSSREELVPSMWDGPKDLLTAAASQYRRNPWADQDVIVEVWLEKGALSGVLSSVTDRLRVGLFVNRGYGSATFVHDGAMRIDNRDKPTVMLYYGDWDPSGADMSRDLGDRIERYSASGDFELHRKALDPAIIARYALPSRPTKSNDPRAGKFVGDSVELDAMTPTDLRAMVEADISVYLDKKRFDASMAVEASEKAGLLRIAKRQRQEVPIATP